MGFFQRLIDKIAEYLPDDEPATEQERIYEEGKKRIYEMHEREKNLFYVEDAWMEGGKAKIYGEVANGSFRKGDPVSFLDVQGQTLMDGEIVSVDIYQEERQEDEGEEKRVYLTFDREKICDKEEFFVKTYYVIKKH